MTYEELKQANKALELKAERCYAQQLRNKTLYIKQHTPMKLRMYERITVRLRVTEETRKNLTDKERASRMYKLGREYSLTGCFGGWHIHEEGNGEVLPCLFSIGYSRYDEIVSIERAEQIEGHCSKCLNYKDGYCYRNGGKRLGKKCANHKVGNNDFTCPKYEEKTELWRKNSDRHLPNVTILKHEKPIKYRLYNLDWSCCTQWDEDIIEFNYSHEPEEGVDYKESGF